MPAYRKARYVLFGTLVVYALLVATHLGEFWPFSIYPMFSQAGGQWSRAVVRVVEPPDALRWQTVSAAGLPGRPYPLEQRGVDAIDLANFVSKTEVWDAERVAGLRQMFYTRSGRRLLVMRVNGRLNDADSVVVEFVPYALLRPDTTLLNPRLPR